MARNNMLPFPAGSQFSATNIGQQNYAAPNTPFNIEIGKVGLLSTVYLIVNTTYTRTALAGATATVRTSAQRTQAGFGLAAGIQRVSVRNNINIRPVEFSGYAAWLSAMAALPDFDPDRWAVPGLYSQSSANLAAAAASTLTTQVVIPIAISSGEYGQAGLLANQDTAITYTVTGMWGNLVADVLTGDTANISVVSTMTIENDYWSIRPAGSNFGLPSLAYAQTFTEELYFPTSNGRFRIDIPGGPAYMSSILEIVNNALPADIATTGPIELYQSANTMLRSTTPQGAKVREYRRIGRSLPEGAYLLDYAHIFGGTEAFSDYALMQTSNWTDGHFYVTPPAGWVAGNNSYVRVIHRALVRANG